MTTKGKIMKTLITYVILLFLVVGCATQKAYEGAEKNKNEISLIKVDSGGIIIQKVDSYYLNKLKANGFETLPGKHTVFVTLSLGPNFGYRTTPPVKMVFDTEAGKTYIVNYKNHDDSTGEYFVMEEGSKKIIYSTKN
jgi:hypothetical protein